MAPVMTEANPALVALANDLTSTIADSWAKHDYDHVKFPNEYVLREGCPCLQHTPQSMMEQTKKRSKLLDEAANQMKAGMKPAMLEGFKQEDFAENRELRALVDRRLLSDYSATLLSSLDYLISRTGKSMLPMNIPIEGIADTISSVGDMRKAPEYLVAALFSRLVTLFQEFLVFETKGQHPLLKSMGNFTINFGMKVGMREHVQAVFNLVNAQPMTCITAVQNDPSLVTTLQRFHVLLATKTDNLKDYQRYFAASGLLPAPALEQPVDMASVFITYETILAILACAKNGKLLLANATDERLANVKDPQERVRLYKETEIYKLKLYSSNMAGCLLCGKVVLAANTNEQREHAGKAFKYCGLCCIASYCSPACAKADWKLHKTRCPGKNAPDPE